MTTHANDPEKDKLMTGDYLWDRSGTPDPEIQRLEALLSDFRHADQPLVLPADAPAPSTPPRGLLPPKPWLPPLAAAAVILFAFSAGVFFSLRPTSTPDAGPGWDVANLAGAPQLGSKP